MKNPIIQWNCRGLKANSLEVQQLAAISNPIAFCLQETHLATNSPLTLKKYNSYDPFGQNIQRPSGGSSILVRHDIHSHISINTNLQPANTNLMAVRLTLNKTITVCSIYIPPWQHIN